MLALSVFHHFDLSLSNFGVVVPRTVIVARGALNRVDMEVNLQRCE